MSIEQYAPYVLLFVVCIISSVILAAMYITLTRKKSYNNFVKNRPIREGYNPKPERGGHRPISPPGPPKTLDDLIKIEKLRILKEQGHGSPPHKP